MLKNKRRIFDIMQLGHGTTTADKAYAVFITVVILINLCVTIFGTFNELAPYYEMLHFIEGITVAIFIIEYALRIWTSEYFKPDLNKGKSLLAYLTSFFGICDFITILVFFLPFASAGAVAFRMLRVVKVFNLFKANTYNDSFTVITNVLKEKKGQITSSVFIILILMIASSMMMYSVENVAQPEVFENAFSGIWWSASTLLTVGYGDIYPITIMGKVLAIVISFLGVGLVAIPTGIISAGFVEQQTIMKTKNSYMDETNVRFVVIKVTTGHVFENKMIKDLNVPVGLIVSVIVRDDEPLLPYGSMVIERGDKIVLAAEAFKDDLGIALKEVTIKDEHPWIDKRIRQLDISRQTLIIVIRRKNKIIIPHGETIIKKNDVLIVYSKKDIDEIFEGIDIDL